MKQNTMDTLLLRLDQEIQKREEKLARIDQEYCDKQGQVLASDYPAYHRRREQVKQQFDQRALEIQEELDDYCRRVRKHQPKLKDLSAENIRHEFAFPRRIALGKIRIQYADWDICLPRTMVFPFARPVCMEQPGAYEKVNQLLLRLLYALPCGKLQLHIFDPIGLGSSVKQLQPLLPVEDIFPERKVICTTKEIKECLERTLAEAENLIQNMFPAGCGDWQEFNRMQWRSGSGKKVLPYQAFVFLDAPENLDEESMEMLCRLARQAKRCGILILTVYDAAPLRGPDADRFGAIEKKTQLLKTLIGLSDPLDDLGRETSFQHLRLTCAAERMPENILDVVGYVRDAVENAVKSGTDFSELRAGRELFDRDSAKGLIFPVGFDAASGSPLEMRLDDGSPHYLIGGATGQGKSNLLHVLILSLCTRYSPEQAELYLLDFKDGVEFRKYCANSVLPHASLIATEADTEFGVGVLEHLVQEKERRNQLFKQNNVTDIAGFRSACRKIPMPRIVVVIDEFQILFSGADKMQTVETMEMLAKQGRSCGIHLILATQSLSGLDFGRLNAQFGGRIALKCPAEDSKELLGGISANNEAASELEVPFAILNTENGRVAGNRKFSVPYAKETVAEAVEQLAAGSRHAGIRERETKLFDGSVLPRHPDAAFFRSPEQIVFRLGERFQYDGAAMEVRLLPKPSNNLLFCGADERFTRGLLQSVLLSAAGCDRIWQIVYIGERSLAGTAQKPMRCFSTLREWISADLGAETMESSLVILDQIDLIRDIGYPASPYDTPEGDARTFCDFLACANSSGHFLAAFYDRYRSITRCGLPAEHFDHVVGCGLNRDEIHAVLGPYAQVRETPVSDRAFYAKNQTMEGWFKPYVENTDE